MHGPDVNGFVAQLEKTNSALERLKPVPPYSPEFVKVNNAGFYQEIFDYIIRSHKAGLIIVTADSASFFNGLSENVFKPDEFKNEGIALALKYKKNRATEFGSLAKMHVRNLKGDIIKFVEEQENAGNLAEMGLNNKLCFYSGLDSVITRAFGYQCVITDHDALPRR